MLQAGTTSNPVIGRSKCICPDDVKLGLHCLIQGKGCGRYDRLGCEIDTSTVVSGKSKALKGIIIPFI